MASRLPPDEHGPSVERTGQVTSDDFNARLIAQVRRIRAAEDEYRRAISQWAIDERLYKIGQAVAVVAVGEAKNAGERDAKAELIPLERLHPEMPKDANVANLRFLAHQSEHLMNAAKLAVQNRNSELSALQSEASLAREEARLIRTEPREGMDP